MVFFTKKWYDFIYSDYKKYVSDYRCYDKEIIENIHFDGDLLRDEYRNYYINKKNYVSNIENYQHEFGECEITNVLDYEDEFEEFRNKLDLTVKKALDSLEAEDHYNNIENDLYCYALGYYKYGLKNIKDKLETMENVNSFLTGYKKYYKSIDNKFDYDLTFNTSFHDGRVVNYYIDDNDSILILEDGWLNNQYKFIIRDYKIKQDIEKNMYIYHVDLRNFEDIKYYIKIEFDHEKVVEIKNNLIEVYKISEK